MRLISDLHIHSKYSRACSKDLTIANIEKWAKIKGLDLMGTGDFTHPEWIKELKLNLTDDETGILKTETGFPFVLQTEISLIYSQNEKGRRVHNVILAPNLDVVDQITEYLKKHGRVDYDGRPIFKIPCDEFVYELRKISKDIEVIPAHIWTPWFSMFGSKSGFDSVKEAFKDQEQHIHALETGLSSDPPMNWRLSQLDKFNLVSFSDSHSFWPWRLGREATIFELKKLTYSNLLKTLRTGKGLTGTVEVNPSYGKYHFDGHRTCNIVMNPKETIKHKNICPVCKKPLVIGVAYRVEQLADRPEGYQKPNAKPFHTLIPISEILSTMLNKAVTTKTVWQEYNKLMKRFKTEYNILLNATEEQLKEEINPKIADIILKNRTGNLTVKPGYDGVYGELEIDDAKQEEIEPIIPKQRSLKEF
jgi:uncharacterized protein (TIGR00375 family)